jgi:hypothetical protein
MSERRLIPHPEKAIAITGDGMTLPTREGAVAFRLENWQLKSDLTTNNPVDVLYGYDNTFIHQLNVGGNTDVLPIDDLQRVCIRPINIAANVDIYWCWYSEA